MENIKKIGRIEDKVTVTKDGFISDCIDKDHKIIHRIVYGGSGTQWGYIDYGFTEINKPTNKI